MPPIIRCVERVGLFLRVGHLRALSRSSDVSPPWFIKKEGLLERHKSEIAKTMKRENSTDSSGCL